jgi:hypothetical protein
MEKTVLKNMKKAATGAMIVLKMLSALPLPILRKVAEAGNGRMGTGGGNRTTATERDY